VEGGYGLRLADWIFQPYAGLQYVHVREKAFTERDAGVVGLRVDGRRTESLVSELGVRLERPFPVRNGFVLPVAGVAWSSDLRKDDRGVPASFTSAPGSTFVVEGPRSGRDGAQVEAGVGYLGRSGLNASVKYTGDFRKRAASEAVLGELRFEF
jgi:outer membrane autotransporter protein